MRKKGVSPVIATVLLISMVVVLAVIVILWFTSLTKEAITKFDNQNIEVVCRDVKFEASYDAGSLSVVNTGSVPIDKLRIKKEAGGEFESEDLQVLNGLGAGRTFTEIKDFGDATSLVIIPVLLGQSEKGLSHYACSEGETGYTLSI